MITKETESINICPSLQQHADFGVHGQSKHRIQRFVETNTRKRMKALTRSPNGNAQFSLSGENFECYRNSAFDLFNTAEFL